MDGYNVLAGTANPLDLFHSAGPYRTPYAGQVGALAEIMPAGGACMQPQGMMPPPGCTQDQLNQILQVGYAKLMQEQQRHQRRAAQMQAAQEQVLISQMQQIPLGIEASVQPVPANSPFVATPTPVVPMLILRLQIPQWVYPYFLLDESKLGRVDLLGGSSGIPAADFAADAVTAPLENPEIAAGVPIKIAGRNIDGTAHPFYASFRGIDTSPGGRYHQLCGGYCR